MSKKKLNPILGTIITIVVLALATASYIYINQETKKKLKDQKLETSSQASPSSVIDKRFPSSEPRVLDLPNQKQAEKAAVLSLETGVETVNVGQAFNLQVVINAQGELVDGVEFRLNYDPNVFNVGDPVVGTFFSLYPQKSVDGKNGEIKVVALQATDESKPLYEETVITFPVTVLTKEVSGFVFQQDKTLVAAYGGQDLLKEALDLELTVY
ncbi:cohesin domain-containing protein [Patescibacteria group bacterium]